MCSSLRVFRQTSKGKEIWGGGGAGGVGLTKGKEKATAKYAENVVVGLYFGLTQMLMLPQRHFNPVRI